MPNNNRWFKGSIILLLSLGLSMAGISMRGASRDLPDGLADKFQAVFLTDGQVYFGKLDSYNSRFVLLKNVYYLKAASGLQQSTADTKSGLNLIKLGGEAHGPEGDMYIAKDKILFLENLKNDSAVVKAIKNTQ
ncbi:MAG: hypothetical protein JWN89_262 [Parcubacteria group bacterium]|nr:hypothetical protein [Parcubacteria group bacterium]